MSFDTERCTAHTKCNMASVSIFHSAWFLVYVGTFSTNQKISLAMDVWCSHVARNAFPAVCLKYGNNS